MSRLINWFLSLFVPLAVVEESQDPGVFQDIDADILISEAYGKIDILKDDEALVVEFNSKGQGRLSVQKSSRGQAIIGGRPPTPREKELLDQSVEDVTIDPAHYPDRVLLDDMSPEMKRRQQNRDFPDVYKNLASKPVQAIDGSWPEERPQS